MTVHCEKWHDAYRAAQAYYQHEPCGGSLHVVLDDGNVETQHVLFCLEYARENRDVEGEKLALLLLDLTEQERDDLYMQL